MDFSFSDLRNAAFDSAILGDNVKFGGSSWWLAKGWEEKWLRRLVETSKDPVEEFGRSRAFENVDRSHKENIASTKNEEDIIKHAEALKDYAWVLATVGIRIRLDEAERHAQDAMSLVANKAKLGNTSDLMGDINDTLSLIYLLKGNLVEAERRMKEMSGPSMEVKSKRDGEWHFRYALILAGCLKVPEANEMKAQSKELEYKPTYELLLLENYVKALDDGEISPPPKPKC